MFLLGPQENKIAIKIKEDQVSMIYTEMQLLLHLRQTPPTIIKFQATALGQFHDQARIQRQVKCKLNT